MRVTSWVEGLEAPWSLVFLPDGRALVSERPGRIRMIESSRLLAEPIGRINAAQGGESGLMGLALHPRYPAKPWLYAMHTHRDDKGTINRVVRLAFDGRTIRPDRIVVDNLPGGNFHNGGRIGFGPDGHLYVGTGEIFRADLAQMQASHGGKILRVAADGAIPIDNPIAGSPVWSLGHRNVQGLAWHPQTGELFSSEHGPSGELGLRAWDEINVIRRGANYGWPLQVGAPGRPGFVDPIVAYPETATPPSGIAFWRGDLFVATLRSEALLRVPLTRDGATWRAGRIERWFAEANQSGRWGRLRDAVAGPDGALYVLTNNRDGRGRVRPGDDRILRIMPAG
ncbi:MAG: PQQ-dependent sugar dehydrogenase [Alphaproteobacteria bacterium]|nr:PQQ-dependent sugar dehydrogenase [Alphaproteobacteria bacterium]